MLVARGDTSRRIATELIIAERTAMRHVDHIRPKLGLHSRAQVATWTAEHGLLTPPLIPAPDPRPAAPDRAPVGPHAPAG